MVGTATAHVASNKRLDRNFDCVRALAKTKRPFAGCIERNDLEKPERSVDEILGMTTPRLIGDGVDGYSQWGTWAAA